MYPTDLPVSENLRKAHFESWVKIAEAGTSLTGIQRTDLIRCAREATECELCHQRSNATSPNSISGEHFNTTRSLSREIVDLVHRLRMDPGRLTRSVFEGKLKFLTKSMWVEIVAVVATSIIIDTTHSALGLGLPRPPLAKKGEPQGGTNNNVCDAGAWVPILANQTSENAGSNLTESSEKPGGISRTQEKNGVKTIRTGLGPKAASSAQSSTNADRSLPRIPNIIRALGLVPDAMALFSQTFGPHYNVTQLPLTITQHQAEFIAARVAALNESYYLTTSHSMLLNANSNHAYDLRGIMDPSVPTGVKHENHINALIECIVHSKWLELGELRQKADSIMGRQAVIDTLIVAAGFNGIIRVAEATGIPLDDKVKDITREMREDMGINRFEHQQKEARYD